jgi:hypothetical protein
MTTPTTIQLIGASLFAVALLHTFSTRFFERLAHTDSTRSGLWHLLGEVEVVFGFWALVMVSAMFVIGGPTVATSYVDSRNFTEPLFVFVVMVIAGTRPILRTTTTSLRLLTRALPLKGSVGMFIVVMILVPLLGSFITEPAAMTVAALILAESVFSKGVSTRLKYTTLGVLFVNISIGGTLTPFAAPPVLMVAGRWGWDLSSMMTAFGWKAAIAVTTNAVGAALVFHKELANLPPPKSLQDSTPVPPGLVIANLAVLAAVVVFSHHPAIFLGLFLLFLGVAQAYPRHRDRLMLREALLVALFLAGLVVLGGQQQWWLQPVLMSMSGDQVFFGSVFLTSFTDNAALTYLGSLVDGLSDSFKYALVTGAVSGGGLTVIANAPNPAGITILRGHFDDKAVHPIGLLLAAFIPTVIAGLAFKLL